MLVFIESLDIYVLVVVGFGMKYLLQTLKRTIRKIIKDFLNE